MKTQAVMAAMLLLLLLGYTSMAAQPDELPPTDASAGTGTPSDAPVEVVVIGRQPGPPLWKVSNGDNILWIFPYLNWIPKDMIWESDRVARVIAESQEVISVPRMYWSASPLVRLNPVNMVRIERLLRRLDRNPDGSKLQDNVPPELYARYSALWRHYWPDSKNGQSEVRPQRAGETMMNAIRRREGLVEGSDILGTIQRLVRRNNAIKSTDILVSTEVDNFNEFADRVKAMYERFSRDHELECFEQQIMHMEEDLDEMKRRANSWAQGDIEAFRRFPLTFDETNICNELFSGSNSPEHEVFTDMRLRMNRMWLDAAENALATNASTFAVLPINDLLSQDGLLNTLKTKGYDIREP